MPNITITVPATGPVVTRIAAIAQARHAAKFVPPTVPTVVTDLAAVKEMILDYLMAVYQQDVGSATTTPQATIDAAIAQAKTDAAAAIT